MSTLRLLISDSYDPWFNLAVEECIFRHARHAARSVSLAQCRHGSDWSRTEPVEEVYTRRMEEQTSAWRGAAAVAARCSTISAIPVLPLWQASRSTIKPSPRRLCSML